MAVLYFPVLLLAMLVKFYWYHRRPGPCTASEVENFLTPWLPHVSSPCWAKVVSYRQRSNWFDGVICYSGWTLMAALILFLRSAVRRSVTGFVYVLNMMLCVMIYSFITVSLALIMFGYFRSSIYSSGLRDFIRGELKSSMRLYMYYWKDVELIASLDNLMEHGCCCGVDGLRDFKDEWYMHATPPVCKPHPNQTCDFSVDHVGGHVDEYVDVGCISVVMTHIARALKLAAPK